MVTGGDFLHVLNIEVSRMSVALSLFFIFLGLLYWYSVHAFSVLSRCGIKHPKPVPFVGNLFLFKKGFLKPLTDIVNTHGRVCGYYLGRKPVVLIADPDMFRQVLVKDFNNFSNRMFCPASKPMEDCLLQLRNEQWKKVRSILTPTFSAAKMKEMVPLMNTAIDTLLNNLNIHAESRGAFDIHKCFSCFTLDVIASVAFGTQVDSQKNPDDPFVHYTQMFSVFTFYNPFMSLSRFFPDFMAPLARFFPNKIRTKMDKFMINSIRKIIKQREEQPPDQRRRDFLQLMLDTRTGQESVSLEHFDTTNHCDEFEKRDQRIQQSALKEETIHPQTEKSAMRHQHKKILTEDEIMGQAFVFLLAGHDTSSNTLAFTCYLLALHPECQHKVQDEADDFFAKHDSPDYTSVQELKYLDMVICEALRLYPPGFRFTREVDQDCEVNGQILPKGAVLEFFTDFLHHDPEHWPEPEKFIPERFTPEVKANRHPFVYLPFGAGPRSCVGMRLAQLEIRMALVHLFHRFNIVACSETKVPLELKSYATLGPINGIFVKITRRDK